MTTEVKEQNLVVPVLPLRDVVVYPHMVIPLFVGRERSIPLATLTRDCMSPFLGHHDRKTPVTRAETGPMLGSWTSGY